MLLDKRRLGKVVVFYYFLFAEKIIIETLSADCVSVRFCLFRRDKLCFYLSVAVIGYGVSAAGREVTWVRFPTAEAVALKWRQSERKKSPVLYARYRTPICVPN